MNNPLNKDSKMECSKHGVSAPSFICTHLKAGVGLGFNEPDDQPEPDWPFKNGWCNECEAFATENGGWNDVTEEFSQIGIICEQCYVEIKERNT